MPGYGGSKQIVKFDLSKVSVEGGGPPAPTGVYTAKCMNVDIASTTKGDTMLKVKWQLVGAMTDECKEEGVGKNVWDNLVMTQEGIFKSKQLAVVADILDDHPETTAPDEVEAWAEKIRGLEIDLMVSHRAFDGKPRANVLHYGAEPPKDETNGKSKGKTPTTTSGQRRR
jgi:hypothetical protein